MIFKRMGGLRPGKDVKIICKGKRVGSSKRSDLPASEKDVKTSTSKGPNTSKRFTRVF